MADYNRLFFFCNLVKYTYMSRCVSVLLRLLMWRDYFEFNVWARVGELYGFGRFA